MQRSNFCYAILVRRSNSCNALIIFDFANFQAGLVVDNCGNQWLNILRSIPQ